MPPLEPPEHQYPQAWEFRNPRPSLLPALKLTWDATAGSERASARAPSHYLHIKISKDAIYRASLYGLWAIGPHHEEHLATSDRDHTTPVR